MFDRATYNATVPPDLRVGTELVRVHATDADGGRNGAISYELAPSSGDMAAQHLAVDASDGTLRIARPLPAADRLGASAPLRVQIVARDGGEPPQRSLTEVLVTVDAEAEFANKHAPEFDDVSGDGVRSFRQPIAFSVSIRVFAHNAGRCQFCCRLGARDRW